MKIPPEECHSVDEQIIPAKTKYSGIRQYNAKKPVKWGFKNLVRAGASGFMYDFYLYAGKDEQKNDGPEISKLQKCARVVARLCDHLPKHSNHKLFCDNWFITLDLLLYLKRIGIHVCGTVRSNCLQGCALNADKDLKRKGRGSLDYKSDMNSGIIVAKWYDNNAVHIASNFVGIEPMGTMERWSPQDKERKEIPCPQLVLQYNKDMGGVDLADMLISLYRIPFKTKRWYLKVFFHCLDIAKVNSWLLYQRHCDENSIAKKQRMALLDFSVDVADSLISANKVATTNPTPARPGRPEKRKSNEGNPKPAKVGRKANVPIPNDDVRFDQTSHWPEPEKEKEKRQHCCYCKDGFSQVYCSKCRVCLCLRSGRNCFKKFHNK